MTDAGHRLRRTGWLVSATSLALWTASTLALTYHVFVTGLSTRQQQAIERFSRRPVETFVDADPLIVLAVWTTALGVLTVLSLLYYSYAQWRAIRLERRALEREFDSEE